MRRVCSSSGTTGRPTYIGLTQHDELLWREAATRAFWCNGLRPGQRIPLVVLLFVVAASDGDAFEQIGTSMPINVNMTERLINAFRFSGASALLCTASYPLHFTCALREWDIDPATLGLKLILAGGEPGASIPEVRRQIEPLCAYHMTEWVVRGVNVYLATVRGVIANFAPETNGVIEIQLHEAPPQGWEPPMHIEAEVNDGVGDLAALGQAIESRLRDKLIFRARVELVAKNSLPRYEYKAKLVRELFH